MQNRIRFFIKKREEEFLLSGLNWVTKKTVEEKFFFR
jgi:hypothetical protein